MVGYVAPLGQRGVQHAPAYVRGRRWSCKTMIPLTLGLPGPSTVNPPFTRPPGLSSYLPNLKPTLNPKRNSANQQRTGKGSCRAEFSQDAPVAIAIGACMLNSLVFPITPISEDDGNSLIDSTDTRSNLSLSPEESWLPIASILFCIIHIQLEASIRNGDLQGFQIFNEAEKYLSSVTRKKGHSKGHRKIPGKGPTEGKLPSAKERLRKGIERWKVPRESSEEPQRSNGDWDEEEGRRH